MTRTASRDDIWRRKRPSETHVAGELAAVSEVKTAAGSGRPLPLRQQSHGLRIRVRTVHLTIPAEPAQLGHMARVELGDV